MSGRARLVVVGNLPPTTGGQAVVTDFYSRLFTREGFDVTVIDISPAPGRPTWYRRARRLPRTLMGVGLLAWLTASHQVDSLYIAVSGGWGKLYESLFAAVGRLGATRILLHHHSFRYLTRRSKSAAWLFSIAGPDANHIVLCRKMGEDLSRLYPHARHQLILSNAVVVGGDSQDVSPRAKLTSVGFIANLTRGKGIIEFLQIVGDIVRDRPAIKAVIAGPIHDVQLRAELQRSLEASPWLEYRGPVYGAAKAAFFADIDALLLPTRHPDEADPLVINEARALGVAVIARAKGCIPEAVSLGGGESLSDDEHFVEAAENVLLHWLDDPGAFWRASQSAIQAQESIRNASSTQVAQLVGAVRSPRPAGR